MTVYAYTSQCIKLLYMQTLIYAGEMIMVILSSLYMSPIVATSIDNVIKSTSEADNVHQLEDEEFLEEKQQQQELDEEEVPVKKDEKKKWKDEKVLEKKRKKVEGEKRKKAEEKKQKEMDKLRGRRKRHTRSNFEAPGFSKRLCPNGNVLSARPELSDLED